MRVYVGLGVLVLALSMAAPVQAQQGPTAPQCREAASAARDPQVTLGQYQQRLRGVVGTTLPFIFQAFSDDEAAEIVRQVMFYRLAEPEAAWSGPLLTMGFRRQVAFSERLGVPEWYGRGAAVAQQCVVAGY